MNPYLIINVNDFKPFRPLPDSLDIEERVQPFILEAHELDLQNLLGPEFYHDLITNPGNYSNLINGEIYTIDSKTKRFPGLKPMLVYYSFARFILNQTITVTQFGVTTKTNEYSQPVTSKDISRMSDSAYSVGKTYEDLIISYLNDKKATYTLWRKDECDSFKTGKGSFKITRI